MPQIPSDGVPRLFNQTIPLLLEAAGVRYAMNVSKSTYRPSGLPAILTDGSVSNKIKIGNEVYIVPNLHGVMQNIFYFFISFCL